MRDKYDKRIKKKFDCYKKSMDEIIKFEAAKMRLLLLADED